MYALVTADDLAVEHKISGRGQLGASGQPGNVVLIGNKADLHAVGLVRNGEVKALGHFAHLSFLEPAERKREPVKLLAAYAAEHIALVV